ncbi:MAG: imidazoleglycerol-phosphate dehydratase HisB [Zetaproteobacteria bacterium CG12_big_fil_rev_8_21_14_0_65_55_1124]|nr:MAG: imidazoleglycerol-phosphate dehydratase [Zetaproteobacteria bacterium CG1_02_55_237]PIS19637.1 MAG: imidazoleglycerol-phosphate dehydratase HisB [Zetaproteobacteria bacterium CG08_land_8_20_14_0_20_55_17]PIW41979.1 MAG: imidazoleglycerol-phosphate dehydratase HisB [Zetaproteobacteria bacterium CG12_big_fil_rev_8_21_14_0_65_55_1124]PIY53857.1 MAG: imidazoleglycerol-phosphate dehydratase HisB [Zetaproteobacteria bacterium CG_4_10_14_0_8_um_filter_55_43]PIZ37035.1 MAG: imidazoleglycerol-ph
MSRQASITRTTKETDIRLSLNLDGSGKGNLNSSIPFLDHMLEQISRHGLIDLSVEAKGDREIDDHHTVEDIGICLGEALRDALGDKAGVRRYGHAYVPLDEALSRVVLDLSGRPGLEYHIDFPRERVGDFDIDLFKEFFQAVTNHGKITLHVDAIRGANNHHIIETVFKAFGRALRMAVEPDPRHAGIPSTKGAL